MTHWCASGIMVFLSAILLTRWVQSGNRASGEVLKQASNHRWSVSVSKLPLEEGSESVQLVVDITRPEQLERRSLRLDPLIDSLTTLILGESLLVAVGDMIKSYGRVILFIDPDEPTVQKRIKCYWPVVSPNQKLIAYQNWFPRMGMPESRKLGISVLDLTMSDSVAMQVYPAADSVRMVEENVALNDETNVHWPISPIAWSEDSRGICFVDRFSPWGVWEKEGDASWVIINLQKWPEEISHLVVSINPRDYVKPGAKQEVLKFNVAGLKWISSNTIEATLYPRDYWQASAINFQVPESFFESADSSEKEIIEEEE